MRDDAVIRVPRWSWELAKKHAEQSGLKLRVVTATAIKEHVGREEAKKQ